jgi:hypothetical protein
LKRDFAQAVLCAENLEEEKDNGGNGVNVGKGFVDFSG